jgi:hypothetical protein
LKVVEIGVDQDGDRMTSCVIEPVDQAAVEKPKRARAPDQKKIVREAFADAYERLADGTEKAAGFDGKPVLKVKVDAIRDELKSRGFLPKNENSEGLSSTGRSDFWKAKCELLATKKYFEKDGAFWRV